MRLQSHIWVSALLRRAQGEGAFATVLHKGAEAAGAIFVVAADMNGRTDLYGPAPQMSYDEDDFERRFQQLLNDVSEGEIRQRLDSERKFDSDIWVVEIEDRSGRPFIDDDLIVSL